MTMADLYGPVQVFVPGLERMARNKYVVAAREAKRLRRAQLPWLRDSSNEAQKPLLIAVKDTKLTRYFQIFNNKSNPNVSFHQEVETSRQDVTPRQGGEKKQKSIKEYLKMKVKVTVN